MQLRYSSYQIHISDPINQTSTYCQAPIFHPPSSPSVPKQLEQELVQVNQTRWAGPVSRLPALVHVAAKELPAVLDSAQEVSCILVAVLAHPSLAEETPLC
jgi:hypothetical protein